MNRDAVLAALELPAGAVVNQRVPKTLLVKNGAPTATDKRLINEGIDTVMWLAALKATTIGVPEYRDEAREYLEIAVLQADLRAGANANRLAELLHRAIPYPVFLVTQQGDDFSLSLAHMRWSLAQAGVNFTLFFRQVVKEIFDIWPQILRGINTPKMNAA